MDELGDETPDTNEKGVLDMTHNGWVSLDNRVWTMKHKILVLNASHNNIKSFPAALGNLTMMRELNCSINKLESFPPEIGLLRNLRTLQASGNNLSSIPNEIGNCECLEEIFLSENLLVTIPASISNLILLKRLYLQSNRLTLIPYSVSQAPSLTIIDCSANPDLESIPQQFRGDSKLTLWILKIHYDYNAQIKKLQDTGFEAHKFLKVEQMQHNVLKDRNSKLLLEKAAIDENYDYGIIGWIRLMPIRRLMGLSSSKVVPLEEDVK